MTVDVHRVSAKDTHIRTIYLESGWVTRKKLSLGDKLVFTCKCPHQRNPVDLVFRINRMSPTPTASTTAWHPGLGEPQVGSRKKAWDLPSYPPSPITLTVLEINYIRT